jgi:hypothetical protein
MQKNDLKDIDNYLKSLYSRLKNSENDEKLLAEIDNVLKYVDKLNKREKFKRILRFLAIVLLIVGLVILFWDDLYIHVVYLARLLVVMVSRMAI